MKIIFWGTPEYSVSSLNILNKSNHDILAVISQPDKKRARGNKLIPSPVKKYCIEQNIPIYTPEYIKGNFEFIKFLETFSSDLFIVIAYGKILPREILTIPKYGAWNAHASLLPRWRGAAPIQWALLEGDNYTGVGIMKMEEGLDTGDVLIEEQIKICDDDNLISLSQKLSDLSSKLINKAVSKIEEKSDKNIDSYLSKQIHLGREMTYASMIKKTDFNVNWENDAIDIFRRIRALYPNAYTIFNGKNLKIIKIKVLDLNSDTEKYSFNTNCQKPGYIIGIDKNEGIIISTNTYPILLLEAKLEGKNTSSKMSLIQQLKPIVGTKFSD